jgi:hypothetical protein
MGQEYPASASAVPLSREVEFVTDDRAGSLAWDRVGRLMQQTAATSQQMSERNLDTWSKVSTSLRKKKYTADDMAKDAATLLTSAMDDMADMLTMWTNGVGAVNEAQAIPTVFLYFGLARRVPARVLDPVLIEVRPEDWFGRKLPKFAKVAVNGRSSVDPDHQHPGRTSRDGVADLLRCLVARRVGKSPAYELETVHYPDKKHHPGLVPGVYDGVVYLTDPPLLLANLRILVEGAASDVDREEGAGRP